MTELYTMKEAAGILKVSRQTLHKLKTAGKIPFFTVGNQIRFSKDEIMDYIRNNTKKGKVIP